MSNQNIIITIAQSNLLVGDIEGNVAKIISLCHKARDQHHADVIVFPELAITGYPPEDLLLRHDLYRRVEATLDQLAEVTLGIDVIVGYPCQEHHNRYNSLGYFRDGKQIAHYHKQRLPNYSVFDEERYFTAGKKTCLVGIKGVPVSLTICEDLWFADAMMAAKTAGAKLMISINASPFDHHKPEAREKMLSSRANEGNMPIIYVNSIGGQDELVFDGGSMAVNANGDIQYHADFCKEELVPIEVKTEPVKIITTKKRVDFTHEHRTYDALVLGVRDYIHKNGFKSAVIGLSGGIDSALTLAIAVDAIGHKNVEAVLMPSRYTSDESIDYATEQCKLLNVEYSNISIEQPFKAFLDILSDEFRGYEPDVTEENIQARCRGIILMAISNKKGAIVLSTGNKSELSVGYSTLYGDLVGGFCVLKDIPKTLVYHLADYRNSIGHVIPQDVIDRVPSAELAPNQTDQDLLPPYPVLDEILERYVEHDQSVHDIVDAGLDYDTVIKVMKMVDRNEYKRRQAPIGVRVTQRAFGRDWRHPITSGYGRYYKKRK